MLRHAGYITRNALTDEEKERFDRELAAAYFRLGNDSPLVNSNAYRAGLRARIVRERKADGVRNP